MTRVSGQQMENVMMEVRTLLPIIVNMEQTALIAERALNNKSI
jgi:hypothetical protein